MFESRSQSFYLKLKRRMLTAIILWEQSENRLTSAPSSIHWGQFESVKWAVETSHLTKDRKTALRQLYVCINQTGYTVHRLLSHRFSSVWLNQYESCQSNSEADRTTRPRPHQSKLCHSSFVAWKQSRPTTGPCESRCVILAWVIMKPICWSWITNKETPRVFRNIISAHECRDFT